MPVERVPNMLLNKAKTACGKARCDDTRQSLQCLGFSWTLTQVVGNPGIAVIMPVSTPDVTAAAYDRVKKN